MEKLNILIEKIKESNLRKKDKRKLIKILKSNDIDLDNFTKLFLSLCKIGKGVLKLFDIDI